MFLVFFVAFVIALTYLILTGTYLQIYFTWNPLYYRTDHFFYERFFEQILKDMQKDRHSVITCTYAHSKVIIFLQIVYVFYK